MARANTEALTVGNDWRTSADSQPINEPLLFQPILRPQVWGGTALANHFGKQNSVGESIGESWEVSGLPGNSSIVASGTFTGKTLSDLWRQGQIGSPDASAPFPLLVKWLDCRHELSVQVHPTDAIAQQLLGHHSGKSEAWVVVHAEPDAKVYAGLKAGVTEEELRARLDKGTVAECLHSFTPLVGDCISLPGGTIHSAGGGVVFAEVQQPSDATFRLFDWNRVGLDGKPRQLHRDVALQSITWPQGPVCPSIPRQIVSSQGCRCESLLRTGEFELERYTLQTTIAQPRQGEMTIWMVLDGAATFDHASHGTQTRLERGSTLLIPAGVRNGKWSAAQSGKASKLLCIRVPQPVAESTDH